MLNFNPFKGIIKTKIAPHNRTLRTSFGGKLEDAFYVLFGVPTKTLGIIDVFTLGISCLIDYVFKICNESQNKFVKYGLGAFIGLFEIPLLVARALTAIILVLNPLSLLIVGIIHVISQHIAGGQKLKQQALTLRLMSSSDNDEQFDLQTQLKTPKFDNKNYQPRIVPPNSFENFRIEPNNDLTELEIKQAFTNLNSNKSETILTAKCYLPIFSQLNNVNDNDSHNTKDDNSIKHVENLPALKALIQLNVGNVTANLEKTPQGKTLLNNIMTAPVPVA